MLTYSNIAFLILKEDLVLSSFDSTSRRLDMYISLKDRRNIINNIEYIVRFHCLIGDLRK